MRNTVCERARILPDCEENMVIELRVASAAPWVSPGVSPPCREDVSAVMPAAFDGNRAGQLVVVRACYAVSPFLPGAPMGTRLVSNPDGDYRMVAASVFIVEPPET